MDDDVIMIEKGSARPGYRHGMAGKTARSAYNGVDKIPRHYRQEEQKNKAEIRDNEGKMRDAMGMNDEREEKGDVVVGKGRKGEVLREKRPQGKSGVLKSQQKAAANEWTVVASKNKKKKKDRQRNGPVKMDASLTPVQYGHNYKEYTSTDVPNVRTRKKIFLVESEGSVRSPESIARVGTRDQSRRNW